MTVHQCPFCELRFQLVNELKHHWLLDHRDRAPQWGLLEPSEQGHATSFRDDVRGWTPHAEALR